MKLRKSLRSAIYNNVWSKPKSLLGSFLRRKCDGIPEGRRLTVIAVLAAVFVLAAFFVFGHACYRMGRGYTLTEQVDIRHIEGVELPAISDSGSLMVGNKIPDYDFSGTENENN